MAVAAGRVGVSPCWSGNCDQFQARVRAARAHSTPDHPGAPGSADLPRRDRERVDCALGEGTVTYVYDSGQGSSREQCQLALEEVAALLASTPGADHSSSSVACAGCSQFWDRALEVARAASSLDAPSRVADLYTAIPPHPCPSYECVDCEGCLFELREAMGVVALTLAGVDTRLGWGPGHAPEEAHGESWQECPSCCEWVEARVRARASCQAAGIEADRWLGPTDVPPSSAPAR